MLVHLVAIDILANIQDRAGVIRHKLGMPLKAQHLIADVIGRNWAERTAGQYRGVNRGLGHLVLVTDQQRQLFGMGLQPLGLFDYLILMHTNTPALPGPFGFTAQHQRQQLVAEADAHELVAMLVALQHIGAQGLNPVVLAKGVVLAASDQISVEVPRIIRVMTLYHIEYCKLGGDRLACEQLLKHPTVSAVLLNQFRPDVVGFEDANTQGHQASLGSSESKQACVFFNTDDRTIEHPVTVMGENRRLMPISLQQPSGLIARLTLPYRRPPWPAPA